MGCKEFCFVKKYLLPKSFIERKPAVFCGSCVSESLQPLQCRAWPWDMRDSFHTFTWVAARQLIVHCSVLVRQAPHNPRQRDLSYYTQILAFFSLLCSLWHRAQFIHVHCFISSRAFTELPYTSSLGFKALPRKLKQVWKLLLAWRLGSSSIRLHKAWPASPQHLILGPCAIIIMTQTPYSGKLGVFQLKVSEKKWQFCQLHFCPVAGGWWLVCNACSVVCWHVEAVVGANPS